MRKHSEPRSESNSTPDPKREAELLLRVASGEMNVREMRRALDAGDEEVSDASAPSRRRRFIR